MTAVPALVTDIVGVIRSLGDEGITSIVVSEYKLSPTFWSRHCARKVVIPSMGERQEEAISVLMNLGAELKEKPVVMVGRESDVDLVSSRRETLSRFFRIKMAPPPLMASLNEKWAFATLARKFELPVPRTWRPESLNELRAILNEIPFPCLLKPPSQGEWARDEVYPVIGRWKKVVFVHDANELTELFEKLQNVSRGFMIQEFIPGAEDAHFDFHAYCPEPGRVAGYFCGQKIRTHPIHFGRGSYTRAKVDPDVSRTCIEALEKIGYVGPANINTKRDPRTGKVHILEINPRFSLWTHLASRSGVNLPLAMYNDCLGIPLPKLHQDSIERRWLYLYIDWCALRSYRKTREWTIGTWLKSLCFLRIVFFRWDAKDPLPLLGAFWGYVWLRVRLRLERLFPSLQKPS